MNSRNVQGSEWVTTYRAPLWLPGGQLQTIYAYSLSGTPGFVYRRERWETPDGDFIDLDWLDGPKHSKLVVLFHGLEGCSSSHYAVSLMNQLQRNGYFGVVPHFRGCSGSANRLPRAYHSGDSMELDWILRRLKEKFPRAEIYAVGISLGGNMLLKWLGEQSDRAATIVERAVAVSAPLDLEIAAQRLDRGCNKFIYTRHFLMTLRRKALGKISTHGLDIDPRAVKSAATFRQFDDAYTAPVHGFRDAQDYWRQSSSKPWLRRIKAPTLLINARNDPFFPGDALPVANEVSATVRRDYPESGGHVGFVSGRFPGHLDWLPRRVLDFFFGPTP